MFTDPLASPTSFPLKVALLEGTISDQAVYDDRTRVCNLGYLREAYRTADGQVGFRCAAEPVSVYVSKGGSPDDVRGRKCICNALVATMGLPQLSGAEPEPAIITTGNALEDLTQFMPPGGTTYTAADVVARLLGAAAHPRPYLAPPQSREPCDHFAGAPEELCAHTDSRERSGRIGGQ